MMQQQSSSPSHSNYTQSITLTGMVGAVLTASLQFELKCANGEMFLITVGGGGGTNYDVVRNMDGLDRNRIPNPDPYNPGNPADELRKYIRPDTMVSVRGVEVEHQGQRAIWAQSVTLMVGEQGNYMFEDTHWWLTQIARFADEWLDDLFQDRRTYEWDDFSALYRTNLNILGMPTDDKVQECATLSRLNYGLSSAYLLTGAERYRLAAKAGVKYQRETFRSLSHDGKYCFWQFGKRQRETGANIIIGSENPDDAGTIPLYEQIYALAGLTQYFRISQDWSVLQDIHRTIRVFQDFYRDDPAFGYGGTGGYFSHLDPATLRPDVASLNQNQLRKNWNSVGDHIPAYLVNLILALDPVPQDARNTHESEELLEVCRSILKETSEIILDRFPDKDPAIPYVNERFFANWEPDHQWGWQQNRAIVGHNFKIAWNLTRTAHYYRTLATKGDADAAAHSSYADRLETFATELLDRMSEVGIDLLRGGCFDAVEREPVPGMPVQFAWSNTKDFWQQEQAILAYLILHGVTHNPDHLQHARAMMAFWNTYFLDHDNRGVFFRTTDMGMPVITGTYGQKASHAVAGYHSFELNYLAHTYICLYVRPEGRVQTPEGTSAFPVVDQNFCLFFRVEADCPHRSLNVLPDFVPPGSVEIASVVVGGVPREPEEFEKDKFQITLSDDDLDKQIMVEFRPLGGVNPAGRASEAIGAKDAFYDMEGKP
jgi:mannose/cellobiose epimerase-like protein (N-acyl-D-glucosamine 2-epimerase family)